MTKQVIPDEAVEAAWAAFYAEREDMSAALEAAAQFILVEAWDAGHESGFWNGRESRGDVTGLLIGADHAKAHNPYRTEK